VQGALQMDFLRSRQAFKEVKVMDIESTIRDVPDFPKKGIVFKDITTLLKNPIALRDKVQKMLKFCQGKEVDIVVGIEARGFISGALLAYELGCGFVPVRKPGKLPAETISESYTLEYGTNTVEIHTDAIEMGQKVLIIDDLLATGGTAKATCKLVERLGGEIVGLAFIIELLFLKGRDELSKYDIFSVVKYD
jgi:adenine phosphoribosyltransferase